VQWLETIMIQPLQEMILAAVKVLIELLEDTKICFYFINK
jgi:hypothetical protein